MADKGKSIAVEKTKEQKKARVAAQVAKDIEDGIQRPFHIGGKDTLDASKLPKAAADLKSTYVRKFSKKGSGKTSSPAVTAESTEPVQSVHTEAERSADSEDTTEATPAKKIKYSNRGVLPLKSLHNQIANLNTEISGLGRISEMMTFLRASRIGYAISCEPIVYKQLIEEFWDTATVDIEGRVEVICAKVRGVEVRFGEADLRKVLEFGDRASDPAMATKNKVRKCAVRCGYPDVKNEVKKKFFDPAFKYFCHILILCLSSRKAGTDSVNEELMTVMASLMMNMKLNITRIIWGWMIKAAKNPAQDFLLYPRFVQLLLNEKYKQIKPTEDEVLRVEKIQDSTVLSMHEYRGMEKPADAKFWGAMVKEDYVCPDGDAVDHGADSDCDLPVIDVEIPVSKQSKKRKAEEHLDKSIQTLHGEPPKQRRHAALSFRPKIGKDGSFIPGSGPSTSGPDAAKRPGSGVSANVQPDLADLLRKMESLSINVTRIEEEAKTKEDEAAREKQQMEQRMKKMENSLAKMTEKFKKLKFKYGIVKKEVKILNKMYDRNAAKMAVNKDGFYKLSDLVEEDDLFDLPPDSPIQISESESESSGTDTDL